MSDPANEAPDLERLFEDLAHPNPYLQAEAYAAMGEYWLEESIPRLLSLLDQPDVSLRRASVRALGSFGACTLLPLAEMFHASEDGTVRASCIKAYAQIASNYPLEPFPKEAMDALELALKDDYPVVSVAAVMALGQVGKQALDLLRQVCKGDNPAQAVAAVNALAQIDDPSVEICFGELLEDESTDSYVRETVNSSLERVKDMKSRG
ncbi:MAG: HEAT repeat domain-containing protein [Prochlorococcus sp.]|nr:HEAT repeat domain-containing protein [Prochlorococcus sp.]